MNNLIQFKLKPVKFLWSPNGENEAWRLTTKSSVVSIQTYITMTAARLTEVRERIDQISTLIDQCDPVYDSDVLNNLMQELDSLERELLNSRKRKSA